MLTASIPVLCPQRLLPWFIYCTLQGAADAGGHRRKTIVKPDYVSGHVVSAVKRFNKLYASQLQPRLGRKLPSLQALSLGVLSMQWPAARTTLQ